MTLRARLALGLLIIVVVLVAPLLLSVRTLRQLHRDAQGLRDGEFAASLLLGKMRESLNALRRLETALLFVHDQTSRDALEAEVHRMEVYTDSLDRTYGLTRPSAAIRGAVHEMGRWIEPEYAAAVADQRDLRDSISQDHIVPALDAVETSILSGERDLRQRTRVRMEQATTALSIAEQVAIVALVLALLIALVIAIWLVRTISRPRKFRIA